MTHNKVRMAHRNNLLPFLVLWISLRLFVCAVHVHLIERSFCRNMVSLTTANHAGTWKHKITFSIKAFTKNVSQNESFHPIESSCMLWIRIHFFKWNILKWKRASDSASSCIPYSLKFTLVHLHVPY